MTSNFDIQQTADLIREEGLSPDELVEIRHDLGIKIMELNQLDLDNPDHRELRERFLGLTYLTTRTRNKDTKPLASHGPQA